MENQIQLRFNQLQENNYHDDGNNQNGYNNNNDDDEEEQVSDCESVISNNSDYYEELFDDDDDLVKLEKEDPIHNVIHNKVVSCLGDNNKNTNIVAIHKKLWSNSHEGDWRIRCFQVYRQGLKNKYGDENHMKFVWYGSSKENIARIMSRGFGINDIPKINGAFCDGINFFPTNFLTQSLNSCVIQEDGLMHVMLCRVLLEREDIVSDSNPGKSQLSSNNRKNNDNDDDEEVVSPTTYVIRSTKMNTHILPEYVISFKTPLSTTTTTPSLKNTLSKQRSSTWKRPISPWMTFPSLILALAKLLPPSKLNLIIKLHKNLKDRKITRLDFIENLKRLVGVNLLVVVVKLCGEKEGCFFKGEEKLRSMKRAMGKIGCRGPKICKSHKINNVACARS